VSEMEVWRPVPEFDGFYEVSSFGQVRNARTGKIRKPCIWDKYMVMNLYRQHYNKVFAVHRLVAEVFVEGRSDIRKHVNHLNGIISDNRAINLEWCSQKENNQHAVDHGLRMHPVNFTTDLKQFPQRSRFAIGRLLLAGVPAAEVASAFQTSEEMVDAFRRYGREPSAL